MAFVYKYNMNPNGGRILKEFVMTDSQVLSVGEAVKLTTDSKAVETLGTGGSVCGIVEGFVKANGAPVTDNGAGGDFAGTYTAGTSNTVKVKVDISRESVYSVTADATLGTTAGSDMIGYKFDTLASSLVLDESTAALTTASFVSHGPDPDGDAPTDSVLVTIYESIFWHIA